MEAQNRAALKIVTAFHSYIDRRQNIGASQTSGLSSARHAASIITTRGGSWAFRGPTTVKVLTSNSGIDDMKSKRLLDRDEVQRRLDIRLDQVHGRLRLGIEHEHEAQAFGQGLTFMHLENMPPLQLAIEVVLRATGTYWRGRANAEKVQLKQNVVRISRLPAIFDGFTILHLSDLHADMSGPAMRRVAELALGIDYDLCVMTGDYRGRTYGDCRPCLEDIELLREALRGEIYAVLGNHDSIEMVPDLEALGIHMLLNESAEIKRGSSSLYLAGVDDAHFYRADNIEKAAADIPRTEVSVLLSHTPEIYRQAAHAGFDLMLCGHTHGGQICLPGGIPIMLEAKLPRRMGAGAWQHASMSGYTSVGEMWMSAPWL
jgi:predicted MPP superfamily phosphohydrolase